MVSEPNEADSECRYSVGVLSEVAHQCITKSIEVLQRFSTKFLFTLIWPIHSYDNKFSKKVLSVGLFCFCGQ